MPSAAALRLLIRIPCFLRCHAVGRRTGLRPPHAVGRHTQSLLHLRHLRRRQAAVVVPAAVGIGAAGTAVGIGAAGCGLLPLPLGDLGRLLILLQQVVGILPLYCGLVGRHLLRDLRFPRQPGGLDGLIQVGQRLDVLPLQIRHLVLIAGVQRDALAVRHAAVHAAGRHLLIQIPLRHHAVDIGLPGRVVVARLRLLLLAVVFVLRLLHPGRHSRPHIRLERVAAHRFIVVVVAHGLRTSPAVIAAAGVAAAGRGRIGARRRPAVPAAGAAARALRCSSHPALDLLLHGRRCAGAGGARPADRAAHRPVSPQAADLIAPGAAQHILR